MSPAHDSPYGTEPRERDPVDPRSVTTAVQVMVAWLVAFVCVALIALLS